MTDFLKIAKSIVAHICAYGVETVNGVLNQLLVSGEQFPQAVSQQDYNTNTINYHYRKL